MVSSHEYLFYRKSSDVVIYPQEELIERITRKVEELCNTQGEVKQEIQETEEIGRYVVHTLTMGKDGL